MRYYIATEANNRVNKMSNIVETKIENNQKITLTDIAADLNSGNWDALYFASEEQIDKLILLGKIDEDFSSRHFDYQEEMSFLRADAIEEFS
jgi:hypothetical protein